MSADDEAIAEGMADCKKCDGTGEEEDVNDYTSTVDCWICKGSGRVVTAIERVSGLGEYGE